MEDPFINTVGRYAVFVGPIAGLIVALWAARGTSGSTLRKAIAGASIAAGFLVFSLLASGAILFRDGLGPGFVPSTGLESWRRALPDLGIAMLLGGIAAAPGVAMRRHWGRERAAS